MVSGEFLLLLMVRISNYKENTLMEKIQLILSVWISHFVRNPKSNATPNNTYPNHEIIFYEAVEFFHCFFCLTWMNKKSRNISDRMRLIKLVPI